MATLSARPATAARRITLSLPVFDDTFLEPGMHVVLAPNAGDISLYGAFGKIETVDGDTVTISSDALPGVGVATFTRGEFNIRIPGITPN